MVRVFQPTATVSLTFCANHYQDLLNNQPYYIEVIRHVPLSPQLKSAFFMLAVLFIHAFSSPQYSIRIRLELKNQRTALTEKHVT